MDGNETRIMNELVAVLSMSQALTREGVTTADMQLVSDDPALRHKIVRLLVSRHVADPLTLFNQSSRSQLAKSLASERYLTSDSEYSQLFNRLTLDSVFAMLFKRLTTQEMRVAAFSIGENPAMKVMEIAARCGISSPRVYVVRKQASIKLSRAVDILIGESDWVAAGMHGFYESVSIYSMDLSNRPHNCLWLAGVSNIRQLLHNTEDNLLDIRGFGPKCLDEVKAQLKKRGLSLRPKL